MRRRLHRRLLLPHHRHRDSRTAVPEYIRHDIGLGHLVTALNNAGIAAVSIDADSTYVWWGGEPNEILTLEGDYSL